MKHEEINPYEEFKEKLDSALDSQLEYYETHEDRGNNYHYLVCESGVTATDVNRRSTDYRYPNKHKITEDELCEIVRNGEYEMVSGTIYTPTLKENEYYLESYCVGEIEDQLEADMFGLSEITFDDYMLRYKQERSNHYVKKSGKTWYAYLPSDAVWYAIHTRNEKE